MTDSPRAVPLHLWLRRRGWPLLFCVLFSGVAWAIWRPRGSVAPRFETTAADRGRITARVSATGTLSALVTVQVGSQVSGRIQQLNADFNSVVKKGQVIAKIDPELFKASLAQAHANLIAAKGNVARAQAQAEDLERQAKRSEQLAERKLIAPADRDTTVSNAAAARAQVQAAKGTEAQATAALLQAHVNLTYTDIMSPIDGVVISRSVDVGQTVAASLQAPTLFTIAEDLRRMQVDTNVAEADVGTLTPGMPASFSVDAYPSKRFEGKVRQIRNAPQTVQNVVTYDAVIDVENFELKLKPGMTANVAFVYMDRPDVVRMPNAALRFRPAPELLGQGSHRRSSDAPDKDPEQRTVWVLRAGQPEPVSIRIGVTDGSFTEVVEGPLEPGDELVNGVISEGQDAPAAPPPGAAPPGGQRGGRRIF
jgi:HlyD family secretion protein